MSNSCFSCWHRRHRAGANSRMSHQGRFVSPDDLEASIFSERGVVSSPTRFDYKKALHGSHNDSSASHANNIGNFSLSADLGTYDKFKSMEQQSKNPEPEKNSDSSPPKKRTGHNLVRRCFPPVGLSLVLGHSLDIESTSSSKKAVLEQIRTDVSLALNATEDRVRVISIESLVVNLNILGDLGGDMRSPMQLACELVSQARDANSVLRNGVSTTACTDAMIRETAFPVLASASRPDRPRRAAGKDAAAKRNANLSAPAEEDPNANLADTSGERPGSVLPSNDAATPLPSNDSDEFSSGPSQPPRGPNAFRPATPGEPPLPAAASAPTAKPGSSPVTAAHHGGPAAQSPLQLRSSATSSGPGQRRRLEDGGLDPARSRRGDVMAGMERGEVFGTGVPTAGTAAAGFVRHGAAAAGSVRTGTKAAAGVTRTEQGAVLSDQGVRMDPRPGDVAGGRATSKLDTREDTGGGKRASGSLAQPEPPSDSGTRTHAASASRMQDRDQDGQVAAMTRTGEGNSSGSKAAARAESQHRLEDVGALAARSTKSSGLNLEQTGPAGPVVTVSPQRSGRFVSKGGVCHAVESTVLADKHRDETDLSGNFTVTFVPDKTADQHPEVIVGMGGVRSESNQDVTRYPGRALLDVESQKVAVDSGSASYEKRPQVEIHAGSSTGAFTSNAALTDLPPKSIVQLATNSPSGWGVGGHGNASPPICEVGRPSMASSSTYQGGTASPTCPDLQPQSNLLGRAMGTARHMQDICSPASGSSQAGSLLILQQQSNSILSRDAAALSPRPQAGAQQPSGHIDGAISPSGQSSISELTTSSKPPRPPVPTARLGQFDTSSTFVRSSPTTSPPMLAPKMSVPGGSAPFDRRSQLSQNIRPPDQASQLGGQLRIAEDHDKSIILQQNYQMQTQGPNQHRGQSGGDSPNPPSFMVSPQEHSPQTEMRVSQLAQAHTQPVVVVPIEDAARRNDEDESDLYVGPINPFFAGRSSPARSGSFGAQRGLRASEQMSPSASAFHQARRAIATAVDDSRPSVAGPVRSSQNDARSFDSTGGNQAISNTSRSKVIHGTPSRLQSEYGRVPDQPQLNASSVARQNDRSGIGQRFSLANNAAISTSTGIMGPMIPHLHASSTQKTEFV